MEGEDEEGNEGRAFVYTLYTLKVRGNPLDIGLNVDGYGMKNEH